MPYSHAGKAILFAPALALVALSALLGGGCASPTVEADWKDPEFAGRSLRGEKILVVCRARETAIERICQDRLVTQIAAAGATPISPPAPSTLAASGRIDDQTLAAARDAGATAILTSSVAPDAAFERPGPSIGIGIGGFGGSSSGVGGGVGVSFPVGGSQVDTAYGADLILTDVATGRMMWTGKITAPASRNVDGQISGLAKDGVEAVRKAGLL